MFRPSGAEVDGVGWGRERGGAKQLEGDRGLRVLRGKVRPDRLQGFGKALAFLAKRERFLQGEGAGFKFQLPLPDERGQPRKLRRQLFFP